jgi:alkylhydroperoxidase/carboxymuconolactone decarboxylase family protein YurZ
MKNSGELTVLEEPPNEAAECIKSQSSQNASESRLQDLIPIAMVIVGGCEPCAESMVNRALRQGSSWQDIDKTLRIVASTQALDCFAKAVGPEVIARMEKPLVAGRRALESALRGG